MDLSVIIVSFNSAGFIERCLASVDTCLRGVMHEICVVDNASSDQSLELARRAAPEAKMIVSRENLGFAAGVNRGIAATTGRYVLWLNPDAELLDGGAGELIEYCDRHPGVGILGPQLVDPSGRVQLSCRSFPSYRTALFHRYSLLTRTFPNNPGSRDYLMSDWDHRTVREVDWCLRARQAGRSVRYHPGMRVLHHIGGSGGPAMPRMVVARHRSVWRYYAKHFRRHPLKDAVVAAAVWARCGVAVARAAARSTLTAKRAFDVALAGLGLLASLPLWALIAILIKLDDGGPVFY